MEYSLPDAAVNDIDELGRRLHALLGERALRIKADRGELNLRLAPQDWEAASRLLRDAPELRFEQALDLCGVDYLQYGDGGKSTPRFAVAVQLLSVTHNWRLRIRTFCPDDGLPVVASLCQVWPAVAWYEREAFDLFGILFEGHPDLRRILTDYGFIGHPFRRDFPVSGNVEMRFDPELRRVIYQPVSIAPREIVPRVVREEGYAGHEGRKP